MQSGPFPLLLLFNGCLREERWVPNYRRTKGKARFSLPSTGEIRQQSLTMPWIGSQVASPPISFLSKESNHFGTTDPFRSLPTVGAVLGTLNSTDPSVVALVENLT